MTDPLLNKFVALLSDTAETGAPMPTIEDLRDRLCVGHKRVADLTAAAEARGLIRILSRTNGCRRAEIMATGKMTDWNHSPRRRKEKRYHGEALPEELQQAKLWLQRRGYPVYRAHVTGGAKDRWIIGVPDREYTDTQLLNFARSRGWKQDAGRMAA